MTVVSEEISGFLEEIERYNRHMEGDDYVDGDFRRIILDSNRDFFRIESVSFMEGQYSKRDVYYIEKEKALQLINALKNQRAAELGVNGFHAQLSLRHHYGKGLSEGSRTTESRALIQEGEITGVLRLDNHRFTKYELHFIPTGLKKEIKRSGKLYVNEDEIGSTIQIHHLWAQKKYRPESVVILYNSDGAFLLTKTPKAGAKTPWSFPQEGVEIGETLEEAIARGLEEELGIKLELDLNINKYGFRYEVSDSASVRPPFTSGKAYFFSLAEYIGDGKLKLTPTEIADAKWMLYDNAKSHLSMATPPKKKLLVEALDKARVLIKYRDLPCSINPPAA